jgi:hypothetical protein
MIIDEKTAAIELFLIGNAVTARSPDICLNFLGDKILRKQTAACGIEFFQHRPVENVEYSAAFYTFEVYVRRYIGIVPEFIVFYLDRLYKTALRE